LGSLQTHNVREHEKVLHGFVVQVSGPTDSNPGGVVAQGRFGGDHDDPHRLRLRRKTRSGLRQRFDFALDLGANLGTNNALTRIFHVISIVYANKMAEREGFEPPIRLPVCRISSAVLSTTQPPLRH
jgi:hypothetical protein